MFLKKLALAALLGVSAMAAVPSEAEARDRHHRHSHYQHRDNDRWDDRRDYRRDYRRSHYRDRRDYRPRHRYRCRSSGTTGLIRSEEHTSELQSLMRISNSVFS